MNDIIEFSILDFLKESSASVRLYNSMESLIDSQIVPWNTLGDWCFNARYIETILKLSNMGSKTVSEFKLLIEKRVEDNHLKGTCDYTNPLLKHTIEYPFQEILLEKKMSTRLYNAIQEVSNCQDFPIKDLGAAVYFQKFTIQLIKAHWNIGVRTADEFYRLISEICNELKIIPNEQKNTLGNLTHKQKQLVARLIENGVKSQFVDELEIKKANRLNGNSKVVPQWLLSSMLRRQTSLEGVYFIPEVLGRSLYDDINNLVNYKDISTIMGMQIDSLPFSNRALNCFEKNNINMIKDLIALTPDQLLSFDSFGRGSLKETLGIVRNLGLSLGKGFSKDIYIDANARRDVPEIQKIFKALNTLLGRKEQILLRQYCEADYYGTVEQLSNIFFSIEDDLGILESWREFMYSVELGDNKFVDSDLINKSVIYLHWKKYAENIKMTPRGCYLLMCVLIENEPEHAGDKNFVKCFKWPDLFDWFMCLSQENWMKIKHHFLEYNTNIVSSQDYLVNVLKLEGKIKVQDLSDCLGARKVEILKQKTGFVGKVKTLQETADLFDITRERVRQIVSNAHALLYEAYGEVFLVKLLTYYADSLIGSKLNVIETSRMITLFSTETTLGVITNLENLIVNSFDALCEGKLVVLKNKPLVLRAISEIESFNKSGLNVKELEGRICFQNYEIILSCSSNKSVITELGAKRYIRKKNIFAEHAMFILYEVEFFKSPLFTQRQLWEEVKGNFAGTFGSSYRKMCEVLKHKYNTRIRGIKGYVDLDSAREQLKTGKIIPLDTLKYEVGHLDYFFNSESTGYALSTELRRIGVMNDIETREWYSQYTDSDGFGVSWFSTHSPLLERVAPSFTTSLDSSGRIPDINLWSNRFLTNQRLWEFLQAVAAGFPRFLFPAWTDEMILRWIDWLKTSGKKKTASLLEEYLISEDHISENISVLIRHAPKDCVYRNIPTLEHFVVLTVASLCVQNVSWVTLNKLSGEQFQSGHNLCLIVLLLTSKIMKPIGNWQEPMLFEDGGQVKLIKLINSIIESDISPAWTGSDAGEMLIREMQTNVCYVTKCCPWIVKEELVELIAILRSGGADNKPYKHYTSSQRDTVAQYQKDVGGMDECLTLIELMG
jgi:hypothetical protein